MLQLAQTLLGQLGRRGIGVALDHLLIEGFGFRFLAIELCQHTQFQQGIGPLGRLAELVRYRGELRRGTGPVPLLNSS